MANKVGADPDAPGRLLRALIGRGIFKQLGDGRYALTPLAQALRWEVADSMAALACFTGSPQDREHWSHCVDAVRTGQSALAKLRGVLFDLAHVVAGAGPLLRRHSLADRVTLASGSFFDSVPESGDLYVLKNIIHDWPDDRAQQILKTVRAATHKNATLALIECVIPADDRDFPAKWMDLSMLVENKGRERTAAEYRDLLQQSGFRMSRIVPTASPFSVVEARVA